MDGRINETKTTFFLTTDEQGGGSKVNAVYDTEKHLPYLLIINFMCFHQS